MEKESTGIEKMETEPIEDNEDSVDEEELLVYVVFEDMIDDCSENDLLSSKILGLDTDEPIIQMGNKVFGGIWKETIGTAVFFEDTKPVPKQCYFSLNTPKPLKYFSKTHKSLYMKRVFLSSKEDETKTLTTDETTNKSDIVMDANRNET